LGRERAVSALLVLATNQAGRNRHAPVKNVSPASAIIAATARYLLPEVIVQFLLLVYTDPALLDALPEGEFDTMMRGCIRHADDLKAEGCLLASQQLEAPATAKSVRVRQGRGTVLDGPFAETKEVLAGFNLIEADDLDAAVRIAQEFPWTRTGCIEVRPVRDFEVVRRRVGA
jgi:hypothetical protein